MLTKKGKSMSHTKFIDKFLTAIKKHKMITAGDRIIAGVSGGPDSLCLIYALNKLKAKLKIELFAVHINHSIRGKSADMDQQFVEDFCRKLGIQVYSEKILVKQIAGDRKISVEEAGRIARYDCFEKYAKELNANKIAVGHNMNDNSETVLLNLVRGTGIEGLKGIEPVRGMIIRPLIEISRAEIELYCKEEGLNPRIDETNTDSAYTRNRIRNGLIPYIKENFNPNIIEAINRTAEIIYDENLFVSEVSEAYYSECLQDSDQNSIKINLEKFNMLHSAVRKRIIRMAVERLNGSTRAVEKIHIEQVMGLADNAKTGTVCRLNGGIEVIIEYKNLIFIKGKAKKRVDFCYDISIPGKVEIPQVNACLNIKVIDVKNFKPEAKSSNVCLIDKKTVGESLQIRNRRNGDRINPEGMKGTKKLKDYFIDEKIPREQREVIPVVADGQEIIWIIGKRYSEKHRITEQTKEVIVLEYLLHK